jgi:hypothetical protein
MLVKIPGGCDVSATLSEKSEAVEHDRVVGMLDDRLAKIALRFGGSAGVAAVCQRFPCEREVARIAGRRRSSSGR